MKCLKARINAGENKKEAKKMENSKKSQLRIIALVFLILIGIVGVFATYAFPGASGVNTVLNVTSCNNESTSVIPANFTGVCTPARLNFNDNVLQTARVTGNNQYMGVNMTVFNSTVLNCGEISEVKLCYEWWSSTAIGNLANCSVGIDNGGGSSYIVINNTCPSNGANPGIICVNVTANETWTCNNFFNGGTSRAAAYLQVQSATGGGKTLSVDQLWYNVTYSADTTAPLINFTNPSAESGSFVNYNYLEINVTATDSNLKNITIFLFNSTKVFINSANSTVSPLYFNFSSLVDGLYFFNASASDTGNLVNFTETRNVTIDTVNPGINFTNPTDSLGSILNRKNIIVNVTVNDTNFLNVSLYVYNSSGSLINSTNSTTTTLYTNFTGFSDGTYFFNATAYDKAGNFNSTQTRNVTIDTLLPNVNFTNPTEISGSCISRNNVIVNVSASDDGSGLKNITLYFYNSTRVLINSTNATVSPLYFNLSSLVDGLYFFNSSACDNANQCNSTENRNVTLDTVNPGINFTNPTDGSGTILTRRNIIINVTVNDTNFLNVSLYVYNSSGSLINSTNSTTTTLYTNFTGFSDGTYFFNATAYDKAGNFNSTQTRNVTIDTLLPNVNFTNPTEISGSYISRNNVIVNVSASDEGSGLKNITLYFYNSTRVLINSTNATVSPLYFNLSSLVDGLYFFNSSVCDNANQCNSTEIRNVTLDTTKPLVDYSANTLVNAINISQSNVYVNITVTEINEANVTFRISNSSWSNTTTLNAGVRSINFTNLGDGTYSYNVTVTDLALNTNTTSNRAITLDVHAPNATLISPLNGTYLNASSQNYTANLSDNLGIRNATLNIYNSTNNLVNQTTTNFVAGTVQTTIGVIVNLVDGVYNWFYQLFDWAGNNFVTGNNTEVIDTIYPSINFTNPTLIGGLFLKDNSIFVNLSSNDVHSIYSFANLDNSLISLWRFEQGNGTFFKDEFGSNDATCFGAQCPIYSSLGKFGSAYVFDGVNNYIDAGSASNLNFASASNDYTFSAWIKLNGAGSDNMGNPILGKFNSGLGYKFYVYNDSRGLYFQSDSSNLTSNYALSLATWYNVVYTKNFSGQYMFVNGAQIASQSVSTLSQSPSNFFIGSYDNLGSSLFNGVIDEVLVFNRSISSNEVLSLYDSKTNNYANNFTGLINGLHTYRAYVIDAAGNKNLTELRNVTLDTLSPTINFTNPTELSGSYANKNFVLINVTSSDTNLANLTINLYNITTSVNSTTAPDSNYLNISSLPEGIYFFNATAVDLANNLNSTETRNITLDRTIPLINYGVGTAVDGTNASQNFVYINVSVTETNEANITFRISNSSWSNTTTFSAGNRNINFTDLADSIYTYNVTITDKVNLQNTTFTYRIILDRTAPNATLISPANGSYSNSSLNNFTANLSDNLAGIRNATLNIYNSTNNLVNQTTTIYTGTLNAVIGTVVTLADNVYTWFYNLFDFAGNLFTSSNNTVTVDTTNALISYGLNTLVNGVNISQSNVYVNVSITEINEANVTFRISNSSWSNITTLNAGNRSINFTNLGDGTYSYNVTVTDLALNTNTTAARTITLDRVSPTLNFTSSTENSSSYLARTNIAINVTSSDATSGVNNLTINLYNSTKNLINSTNSTTSPLYINFAALADGIYYFNSTVYDYAGNYNNTETRNVTLDTTKPLVDYSANTLINGINISQSNVYVNVTVVETNEANVTFRISNSSWSNTTTLNAGVRSINFTNLGDGTYSYNVSVIDLALNTNTTSNRAITLDVHAPNATLLSPLNGSYSNSSLNNFTANLSDNLAGIRNATLNIYNSTNNLVNQTTTIYTGTLNAVIGTVVTLADNVYTWFYNLLDFAGNLFTTANNTIIVDMTNPSISNIVPLGGTNFNISNIIEIAVNVTDINPVSFSMANITYPDASSQIISLSKYAADKYNNSFTAPNLIGRFNVSFFINDSAGNINDTEKTYFIVNDNIAPGIVFTLPTPANGTMQGTNVTVFQISVTDNIAVGTCILNLDGVDYLMNKTGSMNAAVCNITMEVSDIAWHNFTARLNDSSGNFNFTENRTYYVDTNVPNPYFITPPTEVSGSYLNRNNILINSTYPDIDRINITISLYNFTMKINETTVVTPSNYVNLTGLNDGVYTFNSTAFDNLNRLGYTETRIVTIDTTKPLVDYSANTLINGINISQSNVYVNVSITEINEANVTFRISNSSWSNITTLNAGNRSINFTNLGDGIYSYNVSVTDLASNSNTTATRTITLDKVSPTLNFTSSTENSSSYLARSNIAINVTSRDATGGINNLTIDLYNSTKNLINSTNSTTSPLYINFASLADGVYYFNSTVYDYAGNYNNTETRNVTLDTTKPLVDYTFGTLTYGANVSQDNIYVNVSVIELNEANITFELFDQTFNLINSTTYYNHERSINWTDLYDGTFYYNLTVFDLSGNYNTTSLRAITLDPFAPSGFLVNPTNGSYLNNSNNSYTATIFDNLGVRNATLTIYNSTTLVNQTTINLVAGTVSSTIGIVVNLVDGVYNWFYQLFDWAGNYFISGNNTVTLDTIRPLINFTDPSEISGTYVSRNNIIFNISANDSGSGITNITTYLFNATNNLINMTLANTSTLYLNFAFLPEGVYYFNSTARDHAGNYNNTETRNVTLDTTKPLVDYSANTLINGINISQSNVYVNVTVVETNEANVTFRISNSSWSNTTTLNAGVRSINFTNLGDGTYSYNVSVIDLALNTNTTSNRAITLDVHAPNATLLSPLNGTYLNASSQNYTANLSDNLGIRNATLNIYNSTNNLVNQTTTNFVAGTVQTTIGVVVNLVDGIYNWFYQLFDWAGNNFISNNNTEVIDTTFPIVAFGNGTADNDDSLAQKNIYINVSVIELNEANIIFSLSNATSLINSTSFNIPIRTVNFTNLSDGIYFYNVTVIDLAGNKNSTETRNLSLGKNPPKIYNVTYSPNSTDDIDPYSNITFSAVVVPGGVIDLDTVILEYNDGTGWVNKSMTSVGGNIYQINLTLAGLEANYSYFIFANDSVNNNNKTTTHTFNSSWDCSWNLIPFAFGVFQGFNELRELGHMSIVNTGDAAFANGNCSLDFYVNSNLPSRVYYDGSYFPVYTNIPANTNQTFEVKASFLNNANSESLIITVNESKGISTSTNKSITASLITVTGNQPYLFESIESIPSVIYLDAHDVSFSAYLRNLVGDGSQLRAARNVNFNWTLPGNFIVSGGNATINYPIILDNVARYSNLNVSFNSGNLPGMIPGTYTISLYANGYNSTGNPIIMLGNKTLLNESANITLVCSSTKDGIIVTACGAADGDYVAPVVPPVVITTGGGGAAPSGGGGGGAIVYSHIINIVRGQGDSFTVNVSNRYNATLENMVLSINGFDSNYIRFTPAKIDSVGPGETKYFTVTITSPKYLSYEEHNIQAIITGDLVTGTIRSAYRQTENIKLIIQEISLNKSEVNLAEAEKAIADMALAGLNVAQVVDLLNQAKLSLNQSRNKEAFDLATLIIETKQKAFQARSTISLVLGSIADPKKIKELTGAVAQVSPLDDLKYVNLSIDFFSTQILFRSKSAEDMINLAIVAFERGDYDLAQQRADSARALLILERKGSFMLFVYLYWQYILFSIVALALIGFVSYRAYQRSSIFDRIFDLDKGESNIKNLIIKAQQNYFAGKLAAGDYHKQIEEYNARLAKIKNDRINLRNKRIKLLAPEEISRELNVEKNQVESEIIKSQKSFYRDKTMTEPAYKEEFKMLNERLAEIEDESMNLSLASKYKKEAKPVLTKEKDIVIFDKSSKSREHLLKKEFSIDKQSKLKNFFKKFFKGKR